MLRTAAQRALITTELAWTASLVAAAYVISHAPPGSVAHALAAFEYSAARLICHQRPERSFFVWDVKLPVCARCAGIYAGAACAAVFGTRRIARPGLTVALAALPAVVSLVYEWTTGVTPSNLVRAATGVIAGFTVMAVLLRELRGE
ncbi:MAG TPA: DUF2085 domain-containing protein [Vicinamibacterales bacterium]|jgi:uncharacterized membrane protein|nr:DUF2085 domain-containing protein [Vicinamibacterales bacterium]